jgi:hypothetical protein
MIGKADLKSWDFDCMYAYFDYICQSRINGQNYQAISLMADLSKPQKVEFINYLNREKPSEYTWLMDEITKILKK